jgi:hypothetical protein
LKREIRRERRPRWVVSRHHGTSDAVVRSSPFLPVGPPGPQRGGGR